MFRLIILATSLIAVNDAIAQLTNGGGYSNDILVAAVNDICGLQLTPVTMVE